VRVLITGATGFVGQHLIRHLQQNNPDAELHGTIIRADEAIATPPAFLHTIDLCDGQAVQDLIRQIQPQQIYHLAAQSSPRRSFTEPWATLENNIRAQLNITIACLALRLRPRILIISSADIYSDSDLPIHEDSPFYPRSPYSVSKITQDMLGLQYYLSDSLPIMRARPFNHTGPGQQEGFVAPDFAMQIARIENGQQEPVMQVGNLEPRRDFTDVRDVVRAYQLIGDLGKPGAVYNIASGIAYSIRQLLETLLSYSPTPITVRTAADRLAGSDSSVKYGDASRLRTATGWQPQIPFEQTLLDLLNDCRERVRANRQ
jgi:GDP-4-dehydro-6-deoxy-D-mannose reductase